MPENDFLPTRYHVEVYLRGFDGDLIYWAKSKSPFPVPQVGHHIDGRSFSESSAALKRLRVIDVEHIYWTIKDSHVSHKLMVAVVDAFGN